MSLVWPLVAVSVLAGAAPMSEVEQIERLHRLVLIEAGRSEDVGPELTEALVETVEATARRLVGSAASTAGLDTPAFRLRVTVAIRRELARIPRTGVNRRRAALNALLVQTTTTELARGVVDAWFGLPPMARPDVVAPPPKVLSAQVTASPSTGPLELETDGVELMHEHGAGENGLIDVGEWVRLTVPLRNRGALPWFSASAKIVAEGNCIWVDPALQIVPELSPGETDALSFALYVASDCPQGARRTLALSIADTHRGSAEPQLRFEVTPQPAPRPRIAGTVFDVDTLGSSDGSNASALGPDMKAEFSADLAVDAAVVSARQSFVMPAGLERFFSVVSHRAEVAMVDDGRGTLRAGDDLDLATVDAATMAAVVDAVPGSEAWLRTGWQGSLWLAVEIDLETLAPTQPEATTAVATTPADKAKKAARPDAPPRVPSDEELIALFDRHVTVVPHPDSPTTPGALRAFSGYEVVLDRAAFAADLARLRATPSAAPAPAGPPLVRQRVRLYHALPVIAMQPPAASTPVVVEAEPELETMAPVARREVVKDVERPMVTIDVGAGVVVETYTVGSVTRPLAAAVGGGRAFIGRDLAAVVGGTTSFGAYGAVAGVPDVVLLELDAEVGAAYRFGWDAFEAAPWVTVGVQRRLVSDPFAERNRDSLTLSGGVTGRYAVWEMVGVWADVGVKAAEGGPVIQSPAGDADFQPLMLRTAAGLSVSF